MQPRGFLGTWMMIAAISGPLFGLGWSVLYFLITGIDFGLVLFCGLLGGIAFGLLFGLIMAFFFKAVRISIRFRQKEAFVSWLNITLAEMGYHPQSQFKNFITYKPSVQAGLAAGKISVQIRNGTATIVGPNTYIKKLQRNLRLRRRL